MSESFNIDTTHPEAVWIEEGVQNALKDIVDENLNLKVVDTNSVTISSDIASIKVNTDKAQFDNNDNLQVNLNTVLSSTF